jgi:hypothetical protein
MLRGISGGEKKRLTTGEAVVGGGRKVLLADEISTGLDSETTQQIAASLRLFCHFRDATVLVALLAPPPETFALFDDVLLLAEGCIVFHGSRADAVPFLESLGFARPARKPEADFLVEALSPGEQRRYWTRGQEEAPPDAAQMAAAFRGSRFAAQQAAALRAGCATCEDDGRPELGASALLPTKRYALSWGGRFRATARRDAILLRRNAFIYAFRTSQVALAALVAATLFLRTRHSADNVPDGVLLAGFQFYSITTMFFTSFSEMALELNGMPVFDKQAALRFYDAGSYAVATALLRVPVLLAESALWTGISYYTVGFAPDAGRFFTTFGVLAAAHFAAGCLFRAVAAVGRSLVVASTLGALAALLFFSLGGFVIARTCAHRRLLDASCLRLRSFALALLACADTSRCSLSQRHSGLVVGLTQ